MNNAHDGDGLPQDPEGFDDDTDDLPEFEGDDSLDNDLLEETLRQAAAVMDPVPAQLQQTAVEAYALYSLDTRLAELAFDSLVHGIPVRGAMDPPRMLTFHTDELTVDIEVSAHGLMGQVLPPQEARIEVLSGPQLAAPPTLTADGMGRFTSDLHVSGPFALRLRTDAEVVVTEWLRV
ncbi:hypothetical protein ACOT81_41855 [Streptomyces sp. WI04-05B]|uniref:hypothetical protein n=1 Tax=Streptomyces TaxID=1883 RepID=UPI0029BC4286|nr:MULTISPECIES: hypothetical protein [unclassified Streptomyces]MDX2543528.1 hypothetical protein [Streptomyces sp. WI04-05B]MDX2582984.1 hypothetical protein [Streptomyces sp. WI04-05A]MDX3748681.1 hypothetical protein [Streptomyces sp. AK08-02]